MRQGNKIVVGFPQELVVYILALNLSALVLKDL